MNTLWLYWEGSMPPYIRLCIDLWKAYYPHTRLIGPDDLLALGFDSAMWAAIQNWHVAQRSDVIRCFLLKQYGGMWVDADSIPMTSPDIFIELAHRCPAGVAAYDSTDGTIGVGFIASRPGTEAINAWWRNVIQVIQSGRHPQWLEVSTEPFTQIVRTIGRDKVLLWPLVHISPVSWRDTPRFLEVRSEEEHRKFMQGFPSAWCWMLCHQKLKDTSVAAMTRQECLSSAILLSAIFRESVQRVKGAPQLGRGKALATLNVHNDGLPPNFRESMQAAAARWGAEFVEIKNPIVPWPDAYWEKLNLDKHLAMYERVVYVDRDVIIRADCPSLFDLVPEEAFGAIPSEQEGHNLIDEHIRPVMDPLCRLLNVQMDYAQDYFNSGVMVFSPSKHTRIFEMARRLHPIPWVRNWVTIDQGLLSLALAITDVKVERLSPTFNRCGARLWDRWTPEMDDYIWHFCGKKNWEHMAHTNWKKTR